MRQSALARQSQIRAKRFERGGHSKTMADEEGEYGKAAASNLSHICLEG